MDERIPTSGVWQDGFLPGRIPTTDSYQWRSVPHEPAQYLTCISYVNKNKRTALQD